MRILMMRHGETEWNVCGRIQGGREIPLNLNGDSQIRDVCTRFQQNMDFTFSFIVTSPRLRARQSAEICSLMLGIPYYVDLRFQERTFGELEGLNHAELLNKYGIQDVEKIKGGQWGIEPVSECLQRVKAGLLDLIQTNPPSNKILLVTHGSIIKCLLSEKNLVQENKGLKEIPSNGQVVEVNINSFLEKDV